MMIGTRDRARSSRHTSTPEIFGSITSSSTSAGRVASKRAIASGPSAAVSTRKPSRCSATDKRVAVRLLVVDDEDQGRIGHQKSSERLGTRAAAVGDRDVERERRAFAFARLDRDLAAVRLRDVADDRETETGAAGVAAARPVDAVEALEDALEIAGRDPDAVIAHDERDPVADDARADLDRLARARVLDRVVEQVHERAAHLAPVADDLDVGRLGRDVDRHLGRVGRGLHEVDRTPTTSSRTGIGARVGASCASIG